MCWLTLKVEPLVLLQVARYEYKGRACDPRAYKKGGGAGSAEQPISSPEPARMYGQWDRNVLHPWC